jgi:pimeloyl-ACP methyl ester carboxylesterase/DNA-binding CsgD family transcriptional regulator
VTIAYSAVGDGPATLALISPAVSHVEVSWEEPALEHFLSRLATGTRLLLFNRRGTGLSDRSAASSVLDLDALSLDIEAVLDATNTARAVLLGVTFGCQIAVRFAAGHAERTAGLVLAGGAARFTRVGAYRLDDPRQVEEWAQQTARVWGTGGAMPAVPEGMDDGARYRDWAARLERHTCSPGAVATLCRWVASVDVRPLLAGVHVPTLVIHRRDDQYVPVADGRFLAQRIPGAEFVELPGAEHTIFLGDQRAAVEAIVDFLDRSVTGGAVRAALRLADRHDFGARGWHSLSPAETELAELVAAGMTNAEIAARLHISRHTVDGRLRRVFAKLGINTRVELAAERARLTGRPHPVD